MGAQSEKFVAGSTTAWHDYIYAAGNLVAERFCSGSAPCAGGIMRYAVDDHLSSPSSLTDETGAVTERLGYDAWGQRRNANGTDALCGAIASVTTRGFTGHEMADAVCLVNMNARLYDPAIGRFMSADSIVPDPLDGQSFNRYAYVIGNPLRYVYPTGRQIEEVPVYGHRPQQDSGFGGGQGSAALAFAGSGGGVGGGRGEGRGGRPGKGDDDDNVETVVVIGHRISAAISAIFPVSFTFGGPNGKCNQTLIDLGNQLERLSDKTGKASGAVIIGGVAVAVGGAALSVSGLPQVGVPVSAAGVATIGVGGTLGIGAGGLQIAGGILQGFGGAGFSNAINGTVTLGSSALFAKAGALAASGAQSASGRAINNFLQNANILTGATFDAFISSVEAAGPQQKSCSGS